MTQTDLGSLIQTRIIPKERTRRFLLMHHDPDRTPDSPVPLMHHDPDRSWITDPNADHPKGTHSPVPLMHHDPDRSWITDPNSDNLKGIHPNFVSKKYISIFVFMLHIIISVYLIHTSSHNLHFAMLNR